MRNLLCLAVAVGTGDDLDRQVLDLVQGLRKEGERGVILQVTMYGVHKGEVMEEKASFYRAQGSQGPCRACAGRYVPPGSI